MKKAIIACMLAVALVVTCAVPALAVESAEAMSCYMCGVPLKNVCNGAPGATTYGGSCSVMPGTCSIEQLWWGTNQWCPVYGPSHPINYNSGTHIHYNRHTYCFYGYVLVCNP